MLIGRWPIGWGSIAASSSPMDPSDGSREGPRRPASGQPAHSRGAARAPARAPAHPRRPSASPASVGAARRRTTPSAAGARLASGRIRAWGSTSTRLSTRPSSQSRGGGGVLAGGGRAGTPSSAVEPGVLLGRTAGTGGLGWPRGGSWLGDTYQGSLGSPSLGSIAVACWGSRGAR